MFALVWDTIFGLKSTDKAESALLLEYGFHFKSPKEENHIHLRFLFPSHYNSIEITIHFALKCKSCTKIGTHTFLFNSHNALTKQY